MKLFKVSKANIRGTEALDNAQTVAVAIAQECGIGAAKTTASKTAWAAFVAQAVAIQGESAEQGAREGLLMDFVARVNTALQSVIVAEIVSSLGHAGKDNGASNAKAAQKRCANYASRVSAAWKVGVNIPEGVSASKLQKLVQEAEQAMRDAGPITVARQAATTGGHVASLLSLIAAADSPLDETEQQRWVAALSTIGKLLGGVLQGDALVQQASEQVLVVLADAESVLFDGETLAEIDATEAGSQAVAAA